MATTFLTPKNNASSTLASDITDVATSLSVAAGEGAKFPSTYPFHISIESEILECTNRSTDTLTITRHAEGTSAVAHVAGKAVNLYITAQAVSDLNTAVNNIENAGYLAATFATPSVALDSSAGAGTGTNVIRANSTIAAFDATSPSTQAFGDSAVVGSVAYAARRDHKHAMMANPVSLATPAIVLGSSAAAGAASTLIRSDSTIAAFDTTVPVTQAFGDSAATGSIAFAARRDHKHGMPTGALSSSGSYTGNSADNRAIAHGLGVIPKFVWVEVKSTWYNTARTGWIMSGEAYEYILNGTVDATTAMTSTNFYIMGADLNINTYVYYWVAIG